MGFTPEEIQDIIKFLNENRSVFVFEEYGTIFQFWEKLKAAVKDEKYDLDFEVLDTLFRILNVCLNRKGNDREILKTILTLLDKTEALRDAAKSLEADQPTTIEEIKS